jgi:hypothetical protein
MQETDVSIDHESAIVTSSDLRLRKEDKALIASKTWSSKFTQALFAFFPREIRDLIYHHLCDDPNETVIMESSWLEIGAFQLPHYMNPDIMPSYFIQ